jgi:hypothetical protein
MPHIYPPAPPTISGDNITISRFLQSPALVQRRLRDITTQRFIADVILSGRYEASGGSLLYEQTESIYTQKAPEVVNPGAEYPRSPAVPGPAALAAVSKWGQDVPITDEHIKRYGRRAMDVAFLKIANYLVRQVDSVALAAIAAAVTQTTTAIATWATTATADPLLDLMLAAAAIRANDQGYDPDIAVMSDVSFARMVANSKIISGLTRENNISPTTAGIRAVQEVAGVTPLPTNNLPVASTVFVLDSTILGGLGYERLESPEYTGDPANGVESSSRRDPSGNDQWLVRGRRPVVPIVQEPNAAYKITAV